jgi:hypothetical protein
MAHLFVAQPFANCESQCTRGLRAECGDVSKGQLADAASHMARVSVTFYRLL